MKICFYPNKPLGHKINPIINHSGWKSVDRNEADYYFWWKYTWDHEALPMALRDKPCLNKHCNCTQKTFVDERQFKIFGYKTLVDPLTYKGKYVMKTNANGIHYGVIYDKPVTPQRGFVYQQLFDTKVNGVYTDIRIPYILGEIPFVFKKLKKKQFSEGTNEGIIKIEMHKFSDLFDLDWRNKFREFCKDYIDYGEVDVLHNRIIDVNNTPSAAMLSYMTEEQKKRYINTVSEIFKSKL